MRRVCLALTLLGLAPLLFASPQNQGIAYLRTVEASLRQAPEDRALQLARLRSYYFLAVAEQDSLEGAWKRLSEMEGKLPADLYLAYAGALHVVEAKHALWPPSKLDELKKAQPLLDNAVKRSPRQAEIRYLRLVSCYYLPFFFGRAWSVREDFDALAAYLPRAAPLYPPGLVREIADFVLAKAPSLTPSQKQSLEATREQASQLAAAQP